MICEVNTSGSRSQVTPYWHNREDNSKAHQILSGGENQVINLCESVVKTDRFSTPNVMVKRLGWEAGLGA